MYSFIWNSLYLKKGLKYNEGIDQNYNSFKVCEKIISHLFFSKKFGTIGIESKSLFLPKLSLSPIRIGPDGT